MARMLTVVATVALCLGLAAGYWLGGHGVAVGPRAVAAAAPDYGGCQTFSATGKTVCGAFLTYWQTHGGLAQQGLPLTNPFQEVSPVDNNIYTVQYFERAVFEWHPENTPPYDVLLSLLGREALQRQYPQGTPDGNSADMAADAQYLSGQNMTVVGETAFDATGDATPDYFFTSIGQGCGNCSAEEITVFSGQTIIFDQGGFLAPIITPFADGRSFQVDQKRLRPGEPQCCPTGTQTLVYVWNGHGFDLAHTEDH
ncbi:MAG: hypothetical protein ACTHMJ_02580 [Thermomicrobiales bacterium]